MKHIKKGILFTGLLCLLLGAAGREPAQDDAVESWLGIYQCLHPTMQASLRIYAEADGFHLEYCRQFSEWDCVDHVLYPELVDGEFLGVESGEAVSLPHLQVSVRESGDEVQVLVFSDDGMDLEFGL